MSPDGKEIHWYCPECEDEGVISESQGTRWDYMHENTQYFSATFYY